MYRSLTLTVLLLAMSTDLNAQQLTITDTLPGTFTDISSTGTALGFGDDGLAEIACGFDLGQTLFSGGGGSVWVSNNGAIGLVADGSSGAFYLNGSLPNFGLFGGSHGTPQALAIYWDDLDSDTGDVYYETIGEAGGRVFIVQWQDRPHYPGNSIVDGDEATLQVQIFEDATPGHAQFLYEDLDFHDEGLNNGASATVGYQAGVIGNDVQWSSDEAGSVQAGTVLTLLGVACNPPGDMTGEGLLNGEDLSPFVDALLAGPYEPCADLNNDQQNDMEDVALFVAGLLNGRQIPR